MENTQKQAVTKAEIMMIALVGEALINEHDVDVTDIMTLDKVMKYSFAVADVFDSPQEVVEQEKALLLSMYEQLVARL